MGINRTHRAPLQGHSKSEGDRNHLIQLLFCCPAMTVMLDGGSLSMHLKPTVIARHRISPNDCFNIALQLLQVYFQRTIYHGNDIQRYSTLREVFPDMARVTSDSCQTRQGTVHRGRHFKRSYYSESLDLLQ